MADRVLDVMTTEKPIVKRVYVMLKDPTTKSNKSFTVYGATIEQVAEKIRAKVKQDRNQQR